PLSWTQTKIARSSPRRHSTQALQPSYRASLRRLDQALHYLSQETSSGGNGRGGSCGISHSPRPRPQRRCFNPKPGAKRPALSLQGSAQAGNRVAGESRAREKAGKTARGSHPFGGETNFRPLAWHTQAYGRIALRKRIAANGM